MKTIFVSIFICITTLHLHAQQTDMHQEIITDTTGYELWNVCADGHGRGVFWKHIASIAVDTVQVGEIQYERNRDYSFSIYRCPRCSAYYRYPQKGSYLELLIPIAQVQQ